MAGIEPIGEEEDRLDPMAAWDLYASMFGGEKELEPKVEMTPLGEAFYVPEENFAWLELDEKYPPELVLYLMLEQRVKSSESQRMQEVLRQEMKKTFQDNHLTALLETIRDASNSSQLLQMASSIITVAGMPVGGWLVQADSLFEEGKIFGWVAGSPIGDKIIGIIGEYLAPNDAGLKRERRQQINGIIGQLPTISRFFTDAWDSEAQGKRIFIQAKSDRQAREAERALQQANSYQQDSQKLLQTLAEIERNQFAIAQAIYR